MYIAARFISERRKGKSAQWMQHIQDNVRYSISLMLLKGLSIPGLTLDTQLKEDILKTFKSEFGFSGEVFELSNIQMNGSFMKIRLDNDSERAFLNKVAVKTKFTGKSLKSGEKGTKENPFDNINQAVEYLAKIENEAYEDDNTMKEIAQLGYYYDLNEHHFKIAWASPYVAHTRNNFGEHAFVMSQMEPLDHKRPDIYFFSLKPNMYKRKFLYRGQSDHYEGFPCVPNLFRNPEQNAKRDFLDPLIFSQEMELLIKSHPIVQMLEQGIELLHDKFRIRMHYIGIAQHYYNKTPYLDLTSNLEVAKFFATTNYDATHDCYTPNTDTSRTGVIYYYELKYPDAFQQHHIYTSRTFGKQMFQTSEYALKTIGKQVFLRSGLQNGFLLEMEQEVDFKTLPEVKAVYFKHNVDISEEIFRKSGQGKKYFAEDILQHAWHDRLKERYQNRVVSREAVRLNVSRNKGETEKTIIAKLKDRGIEVDNYVPKFSEEELSSFYQDIDQWWEDFCSDIHFGDAEDELYRETMKQLRHDPKYSKYFTFNK
jgi:FRG domain protein